MRNDERMMAPNMPSMNQAPQSGFVYRVPTDIVELPSQGRFYPENHPWHNKEEVEVRYMTAKEEDILMTPSYIKRGITFERLIESMTLDNIDASTLLSGDKSAIIVNARKNAYGQHYVVDVVCPNCQNKQETNIDLDEVGIKTPDPELIFNDRGEVEVELPVSKANVTMKILTGLDEKQIEKRIQQKVKHGLPEELLLERYRQIITSVNKSSDIFPINNFITTMPLRDSKKIQDVYQKLIPDVSYELKHECENCSYVIRGGLPVGPDFFRFDE